MLLRRTARPLLATWFLYEGFGALRKPAEHVTTARGPVDQVTRRAGLTRSLSDRELGLIVRVHGGVTVLAALNLAFGRAPRTAALLLAALSVPLAIAHQPFTPSSVPRAERVDGFVRNLGGIGAALLAAVDREGKPGMAWRLEHARTQRAAHTEQD